ncbi:hypothetical protein [Rhodoblastus sp.]|uniref:hypothetical protein n=1 Tax=Rhodoblastus sp. TaxID=1962975 RepID=UPI003F980760
MTRTASFGRRGGAALQSAPRPENSAVREEIALTPEQRALLFATPEAEFAAAKAPAASNRLAASLAGLSITLPVVALNFHLSRDDGGVAALSLGWSLFAVGSDMAVNLWLTRKICGWLKLANVAAFFVVGAAISWALSYLNAAIGMGDELTPALAIPAGGAAAALYCLLAGRVRS